MDYDGVKSVVCDAEESDWLDISYSERYIDAPKNRHAKKSKSKAAKASKQPAEKTTLRKFSGLWKAAAVAVLCVAVLAAMLFVDGDFKQGVFDAVKSATASVFGTTQQEAENKIDIPCNLTLVDVKDGVMTFNGGRAAVSLTSGTVSAATETSVTVALDEKTSVVYDGLTSVMVKSGDAVSANSLLGKYDSQYSATITQEGEVIKQVVGSETQLTWNV